MVFFGLLLVVVAGLLTVTGIGAFLGAPLLLVGLALMVWSAGKRRAAPR